jgi:hypothetical protein
MIKPKLTISSMPSEPSRSYIKPIPIVTTYEPELPDNATINKRKSVAGSTRAPTINRAPSIQAESIRAPTINRAPSVQAESIRAPTHHAPSVKGSVRPKTESVRAPTIRPESVRAPTKAESVPSLRNATVVDAWTEQPNREGSYRAPTVRSPSRSSVRSPTIRDQGLSSPAQSHRGLPLIEGAAGGAAVGEVISHNRQREMQQERPRSRMSLHDSGPASDHRQTQFSEPQRSASPRPHSPFGHRPQPNLMTVTEEHHDAGRDSRVGVMNRSGTVLSRANTQGRNGTLSRGANGGTVGNRRGAFGRGAGASIGTQPEEVLGRE